MSKVSVNQLNIAANEPAQVKQTEIINVGSLYGAINLDANVPVALRFAETNLAGRHSVIVINVSSNTIWVGFDNKVTKATGIPVAAGQERLFSLNPTEDLTLYAFCEQITPIRLVEVK